MCVPFALFSYPLYSGGSLTAVGEGHYWSSSISNVYAEHLSWTNSRKESSIMEKSYGFSVRCIKN